VDACKLTFCKYRFIGWKSRHFDFALLSTGQPYLTARGLTYTNSSSVGVKLHDEVKLVGDKSATLAVARKGDEWRVLDFGTKLPWLLQITGC
jgi:hypothetical protein